MLDFDYCGHTISLRSHQLSDGQWMPEAHISIRSGNCVDVTSLRAESWMLFGNQEEANAEAGRLAMVWIDSN